MGYQQSYLRFAIATSTVICCLGGCASVKVIGNLADLNKKNAEALRDNSAIMGETGEFFTRAAVQMSIVTIKAKTAQAIVEETVGIAPTHQALAAFYQQQEQQLQVMTQGFTDEQVAVFRESPQFRQPLAGAVAFDRLTADEAAVLRLKLASIASLATDDVTKQQLRSTALDVLPAIKIYNDAADRIVSAYRELVKVVNEQANTSVRAADAFVMAARTGPDGPAVVTSIASNPDLLSGIAGIVKKSTDDPARQAAADRILKEIENASAKK